MMTKREQLAKEEILRILAEEGYVTYANLFDLFDLNLTKDENVVGYMQPSKARIVLNENLDISQASFVVRHEILHEYLDHQLRMERHLGKDKYDNRTPSLHDVINRAADYEISNRGYTSKDIRTAKHIKLGDKEVEGLVTEIDHPEWINMSLEQIFDEMMKDYKEEEPEMKMTISIGDMGNQEQQEMEDIARRAQAQAEQDSEEDNSQDKKIAKAAKKAASDIEKDKEEEKDSVFKSPEEAKEDEELAKRVKAIKDAFRKAIQGQKIDQEQEEKTEKDELAKAAKDLDRYNKDPLNKFRLDLNKFVRDATATGRGPTWTRFSKKYTNTGLIKPGSSRLRQSNVPSINVYFDRSGSWNDAKTADGMRAIALLNEYVRRGKIKVNLYYFSNNVHQDKRDAEREGGTQGQPILNHIQGTKPDNVIVMTDSDISDCHTPTSVPGAVYFLFKGGESRNLMKYLTGKKQTKKYDI